MRESIMNKEIILIHCFKGISRAPTMIIAYLIIYNNMSLDQAFDFVRNKSNVIDPNAGFLM